MLKYIGKRILMMIPVLVGVIVLIFTLMYFAKGDAASALAGADATAEEIQQIRARLGLDDGYFVRLGNYFKQLLLEGNLGYSYRTGASVSSEVIERFSVSFELAVFSVAFSIIFGTIMGIVAAVKQNTWIDNTAMLLALIGASMPGFLLGLLLSLVFALKLHWLPSGGWGGWEYMVLPVLAFGVSHAGTMARLTRSSMLEVVRQDYIVTAKAKGVSPFKITFVHALRNALIPITTQAGQMLGITIGGVVVAETIFSVPGIGTYIMTAINSRDYPAVQGGILFIALVFGIILLVVDILYAFIDPRIGAQYRKHRRTSKREE